MLQPTHTLLAGLGLLVLPSFALAQVAVTEVMYAPSAPEPEWVELFNVGTTPVNLRGWTLHDATSARPELPVFFFPPKSFVVVTPDTAALRAARPGKYRMLQAQLPTFNNSDDDVTLRDSADGIIESFHYQAGWGGGNGTSLERISPANNPMVAASWGSSIHPAGATPGGKNSLGEPEINLAIVSAMFDNATAAVAVQIRNSGTQPVSGEAILFYIPESGGKQELRRTPVATIPPGGIETVEFGWPRTVSDSGERAEVVIIADGDEKPNDNTTFLTVRLPGLDTGLVITEVMNDPAVIGGVTTAEYLELFNPLGRPVGIAGWKLYDATERSFATIPDTASPLQPGRYLLIASDTTIYHSFPGLDSSKTIIIGKQGFGLNVDADQVVVRNGRGVTVDSVYYWSDWWGPDVAGTRGVSLERISVTGASNQKENWSGSVNRLGGTPGSENSRSLPVTVSDATLSAIPETISPDGDGRDDFTRLALRLPVPAARIVLQVYDRLGRPVVRLANNEPSPPTGELTWDGYGEDNVPLPIGIYVIRLEAYNGAGGTVATAQTTVVVAKKL